MNIKTIKHLLPLTIITLLTACSSQGPAALGEQLASGSQSIPGNQLFSRQNKTNSAVRTKPAEIQVQELPSTGNMRKIVLKAPKQPTRSTTQSRATVGVTASAPVLRPSNSFGKTATQAELKSVTPVYTPTQPTKRAVQKTILKKPESTTRRLTLNGSANFKSGSSTLTAAGETKLRGLALSLQRDNTNISRLLIEGHTDSVGNASMNQVLSLKRANAVADYLAEQGEITRSRMETAGLGESRPVGNNNTRAGRAQNRRVEITATGTRQISR